MVATASVVGAVAAQLLHAKGMGRSQVRAATSIGNTSVMFHHMQVQVQMADGEVAAARTIKGTQWRTQHTSAKKDFMAMRTAVFSAEYPRNRIALQAPVVPDLLG